MAAENEMIKLRIDVDYAYPSRMKSFLCTALNIKTSKNYLKNAKIIARMINKSSEKVKAYWFFTPQTTPDKELIYLLQQSRHEIALHIANNPYAEWKLLEKTVNKKVSYYTVHGTARLLTRLMWKRKLCENKIQIPKGFPLKSFYDFPTVGLDILCYSNSKTNAAKIAEVAIAKGEVLHIHPVWLFQRGIINHRGPFYDTLKAFLGVDSELQTLLTNKKIFVRTAKDAKEYLKDIIPKREFLEKIAERGIDIFTFIERGWLRANQEVSDSWARTKDNISLLEVETFQTWWQKIGKKTRNMVRKAEKRGIVTKIVQPSGKIAKGIWQIHNETPIRQHRAYLHYGVALQRVTRGLLAAKASTFVGAFLQDELVGFEQIAFGDKVAVIHQILSMQEHFDKAVNNSLLAKAVKICASKKIRWLVYGRMGNHPSLDKFKHNNGFNRFTLNRYFIPLSRKGKIAIRIGFHRDIRDILPKSMKRFLIPIYNWLSRIKIRAQLIFKA